jgi:glucosamine-6-phosphate deaminase
MRVLIVKNYDEMSKEAGKIVKNRLEQKPDLVLGLATGSTPLGLYKELIQAHKEKGVSFAKVRTFNLDEYLGLKPDNDQSYHYFMFENLFKHIDIPRENIYIPDGQAKDPEKFCQWYEEEIEKAGGLDLQVVGIGRDGHIGFNEPGSSLASRTRVKTLDEQTIKDNGRFFAKPEDVPHFAITMGVGTILESREILFMASGAGKSEIVARAIEGPVTSLVTASILQIHPKAIAILDEAAAADLQRKDYYKYAEEQARHFEKIS